MSSRLSRSGLPDAEAADDSSANGEPGPIPRFRPALHERWSDWLDVRVLLSFIAPDQLGEDGQNLVEAAGVVGADRAVADRAATGDRSAQGPAEKKIHKCVGDGATPGTVGASRFDMPGAGLALHGKPKSLTAAIEHPFRGLGHVEAIRLGVRFGLGGPLARVTLVHRRG